MEKKYVIMADGNMHRWAPGRQQPKHLMRVQGETLLERTVRQLRQEDPTAQVIITSHDPRYQVEGATRYEPKNNRIELDRFTWELIEDGVCFLYGDTFYTDEAIQAICRADSGEILFAGNRRAIVALKAGSGQRLKEIIEQVRRAYSEQKITECKGWQVFEFYTGLNKNSPELGEHFLLLADKTQDFNEWEEYCSFVGETK